MSRLIKFRAWDTQTQCMYEVTGLWWSASTPGVLWRIELYHDATHRTLIVAGEEEVAQRIGLMQCLHQADPDSTVYEGDMIEVINRHETRRYGPIQPAEIRMGLMGISLWKQHGYRVRVVGNGYEHPKLLKELGI